MQYLLGFADLDIFLSIYLLCIYLYFFFYSYFLFHFAIPSKNPFLWHALASMELMFAAIPEME